MKRFRAGFTLVELTIVLAIAGLIISLVFVAASAAQRNGRDTTRRADTQKLATAIEQWAANNNGALPKDGLELNRLKTDGYIDVAKFKDPKTGSVYNFGLFATVAAAKSNPFWTWDGNMYYIYDSTNPNSYSLLTKLESGEYNYTP